jgi:hypothetical protein
VFSQNTNSYYFFSNRIGEVFKMCFGDGHETDASWTKDACWNLMRMLENIWDSIYRAGHREGDGAGWLGRDGQENQSTLFSRDHLRYVLIRRLLERTRKVDGRTILPIVWYTKSRRNEMAGLACRIRFSTANIPPLAEEERGAEDLFITLKTVNEHAELTPDEFWRAVTHPCGPNRLDYIILYRVLYLYIHENCSQSAIIPAQATLFNTMNTIDLGNKCTLVYLWDTPLKCKNFIKNRLRPSTPTNHQFTHCNFLEDDGLWSNEGQYSERRDSATIAMSGFGTRIDLLRLVRSSPANEEQRHVDFFNEETLDFEVRQRYNAYLNDVDDDFKGLPRLIRYACDHGIVSRRLLQMLLTFRLRWNQNRRDWVLSNANGNDTGIQRNANIALLENAEFTFADSSISDYEIKLIKRRRRA